MTSPENEPQPIVDFILATQQLFRGEGMLLSRNGVKYIRDGLPEKKLRVSYESLNLLPELRTHSAHVGNLVTGEFLESAIEIGKDDGDTPSETYPLLRVINHATGESTIATINVAQLVREGRVPLYSNRARSVRAGEMVTLDMSTLIEEMAQSVGVNPVGALVVEETGAHTIDETGLSSSTHFAKHSLMAPYVDVPVEPRGLAAVSLLQMDIAQAFKSNYHRVTEEFGDNVEVTIRVAPSPDLEKVMLELIDLVESHNEHLYYTYDSIATGEDGPLFSIVDDSYTSRFGLSGESTLDVAVYNAYLAALIDYGTH